MIRLGSASVVDIKPGIDDGLAGVITGDEELAEDGRDDPATDVLNIKAMSQTVVMKVMRPMVLSLKILGFWPRDGKTFVRRLNIHSFFGFLYIHVYAVHNLCNLLFQFNSEIDTLVFMDNVTIVIRSITTAWTFDLFFKHHWETMSTLHDVDSFPALYRQMNLDQMKKWIRLLTLVCWACVLLQLGLTSWSVATMDVQTFFDWYYYGIQVEHLNVTLVRFIMAGNWIIYILVTLSTEIFLKAFYVCVCLLLGRCARGFNSLVERLEKEKIITANQLLEANRLHTRLSDLVVNVDKNFTNIMFLWCITIMINICLKIGAFIVGLKHYSASDFSFIFMDIMYYLLMFLVIALVAADVEDQCQKLLPLAHRVAARAPVDDMSVLYQSKLMVAKMSNPVSRLTGWNSFIIDKAFILTVIGSILTYTVVLLQMSH